MTLSRTRTIPLPLYSSPVLTADGRRLPSHGPRINRWIEQNVRLGPGDYYGQPFRLTSYQKRWIHRLHEFYPETGLYRYKRALFGTGKGGGKTPFESAVGQAGLAGPHAPTAPLVLVAASTKGQADLPFGDMREGMRHDDCPLKPFVEPMQFSIQLKTGLGEAKRVAAVDGSNDGPRATLLLADELHEWLGRLRNVFMVLDGAIGKRRNAQTVMISTAGFDKHSLLGEQYDIGRELASGEKVDDSYLFEWYEAPATLRVPEVIETEEDLAAWEEAVLWANPALAEADFLTWDYIRSRFDGAQAIERYQWERYHLNRWSQSEARWLPPGTWESTEKPRRVRKAPVVLAFCGTYDGDAAAVAAATEDGYVFTLNAWESERATYQVPRAEVDAEIDRAMKRFPGSRLIVDPLGWHSEAQAWADTYGQRKVMEFDWQHQIKRKADACSKFYTAVAVGSLKHDADPTMARHLESAVVKDHKEGSYIGRGSREGPYIGLAQCAVMAFEVATLPKRRSAYSEHGLMTV